MGDPSELGDDLFDFDGLLTDVPMPDAGLTEALIQGMSKEAQMSAAEEAAGFAPPEDAVPLSDFDLDALAEAIQFDEPAPALPDPTFRAHKRPPPISAPAPAPRPVAAAAPAPVAAAPAPMQVQVPVPVTQRIEQRVGISPALAIVLGLVGVLNLGLAAVVVQSMLSTQGLVLDVGRKVVDTTEAVRDEAAQLAGDYRQAALPIVSGDPEGLAAIERARVQLDLGAYESARQTLYALLAVIDRVSPEVRHDIEARARFLLADSWRREADAGERAASRTRRDNP